MLTKIEYLKSLVFSDHSEQSFLDTALQVFRFQMKSNEVYREFVKGLKVQVEDVKQLDQIPFLPIEFFKTHRIVCSNEPEKLVFESSGTTGQERSKHFVQFPDLYHQSMLKSFVRFFGNPSEYCILALLPNYLENPHSSLIYMVDSLMKASGVPDNGYYLSNHAMLYEVIKRLERRKQKTLLFGVSYALLDFAELFPIKLEHVRIIETGGMKGRKKEIVRADLHHALKAQFGLEHIYSEYGMTELLSQAYSLSHGIFSTSPWMRVLIRDVHDPMQYTKIGKAGGVNVIDFANLFSCSFLSTQDLGILHDNYRFEVVGRFDFSDIRGCNLLMT